MKKTTSCKHAKWNIKLGGWVCDNIFCRLFIQYPKEMLYVVKGTMQQIPSRPPEKLIVEFMQNRKEKIMSPKVKMSSGKAKNCSYPKAGKAASKKTKK